MAVSTREKGKDLCSSWAKLSSVLAVTALSSVELFYAPLYLEECIIMRKNLFVRVSSHAIFFLFLATSHCGSVCRHRNLCFPAFKHSVSFPVQESLKILYFKFHSCWILKGKKMGSSYFLTLHNKLTVG